MGGFYPPRMFFAGDFILREILSTEDFFLDPLEIVTAVFRKSDPGNILILGLESDPKSKSA